MSFSDIPIVIQRLQEETFDKDIWDLLFPLLCNNPITALETQTILDLILTKASNPTTAFPALLAFNDMFSKLKEFSSLIETVDLPKDPLIVKINEKLQMDNFLGSQELRDLLEDLSLTFQEALKNTEDQDIQVNEPKKHLLWLVQPES